MEFNFDPMTGEPLKKEQPAEQEQTANDTDGQQQPAEGYTFTDYTSYSATPNTTYSYGYTPPQPPKEKTPKKPLAAGAVIAICAAVSLGFGIIGGVAGTAIKDNITASITQSGDITTETKGDGTTVIYKSVTLKDEDGNDIEGRLSVGEVAEMASASVVEITTEAVTTGNFMMQYVTEGAGSGVIISEDGYIVTNHHVIADATKISVRVSDGTSYTAQLIGSDEQTDLAVIKIEATGLSPAIIGEYDDCRVGDTVVAIGNPLGELGGTVTDGIISALDRDVTIDGNIMTLMQTNTAINPGNSGGGLFNTSGQLIGVVNAKSSGEGIEGLGFAIPIDLAQTVIEDLIEHGYVTGRVETGFEVIEITDFQTAMYYRVDTAGLYVYSVENGSNADTAGLRSGDLILKVNDKDIEVEADFDEAIDGLGIGDTLTITVERSGREVTCEVTLEEYKPDSDASMF